MIKHISFKHGWFYHYRIHTKKTEDLCSLPFSSLSSYLHEVFDNCPDDYFNAGPRSSSIKIDIDTVPDELEGHEVIILAKEGLSWNQYKTPHSKVQLFMLNFDKNTIGVEVPIWAGPDEIDGFFDFFKTDEPLTGHIDVLRVENGKIWVWDFKPNAEKEKYASTQVYFYSLMLSKRTGIPLENFMCGYFDDKRAYAFSPAENKVLLPLPSISSD